MKRFSKEEDSYLIENHNKFRTRHELNDAFNKKFENHQVSYGVIVYRLSKLGCVTKKKHNIVCKRFTDEEDAFLRDNIHKCLTLYDLNDLFNEKFKNHQVSCGTLQYRLKVLGIKKGTHNIRKGKMPSRNSIGTVIVDKHGKKARVKTENGYVQANAYFKKLYFGENEKGKMIIHLNGDYSDFSRENIELVTKSIYTSLRFRKWIFKDPELTKTAILTAQLLELFPDLRHNENQYYGNRRER